MSGAVLFLGPQELSNLLSQHLSALVTYCYIYIDNRPPQISGLKTVVLWHSQSLRVRALGRKYWGYLVWAINWEELVMTRIGEPWNHLEAPSLTGLPLGLDWICPLGTCMWSLLVACVSFQHGGLRVVRLLSLWLIPLRASRSCQLEAAWLWMTWSWKSHGIPSAVLYKLRQSWAHSDSKGGDTDLTSYSRNIKIFAAMF